MNKIKIRILNEGMGEDDFDSLMISLSRMGTGNITFTNIAGQPKGDFQTGQIITPKAQSYDGIRPYLELEDGSKIKLEQDMFKIKKIGNNKYFFRGTFASRYLQGMGGFILEY